MHSITARADTGAFGYVLSRVTWPARICATLLLALTVGCAREDGTSESQSGLDRLSQRTGWMLIADVDAATSAPMTGLRHRIANSSRERNDRRSLPRVGDILEITMPVKIVIVNFRKTGEDERFTPPTNRALTADDLTPVVLPAGARVRVDEIRIDD